MGGDHMQTHILVVDDDQDMLAFLKEGLERFDSNLSVTLAEDGLIALENLKKQPFALVITDLKMPRMDGISLLAYIVSNYPDIPVLVITAYSTPVVEKVALQKGALGYVQKPFEITELVERIGAVLGLGADEGNLHQYSASAFLQLVEMEERTCTLRLINQQTKKSGVLFIDAGRLINARTGDLFGEAAAVEILSWGDTSLAIQDRCLITEVKIEVSLTDLLVEAMSRIDNLSSDADAETVNNESDIRSAACERDAACTYLGDVLAKLPYVDEFAIFDVYDGLLIDNSESLAIANLMPSVFFSETVQCAPFYGSEEIDHFVIDTHGGARYVVMEIGMGRLIVGLKAGQPLDKFLTWARAQKILAQ